MFDEQRRTLVVRLGESDERNVVHDAFSAVW
jgi:hypothetical protein